MNKGMGVGERMFLKKKRVRHIPLYMRGRASVKRYSKDGEFLGEIGPFKNTLSAEGIDEFLRLIAGTSSQHLDATFASITVNNSAGTPAASTAYAQEGTTSGPAAGTTTKSAPTYAVTWTFADISTDTYSDANYLHFWYDDILNGYHISTVQINAGNKPATENWYYEFTMELYSTDTDITTGGLQLLMDLYTGVSALHLNQSGIRLHPTTGAGSGTEIDSALTPDANPTVDTTNNNLTWVWTVADGTSEGVWAGTKIKVGTSFLTNLRWGGCKTDGSSCGTKSEGEEWEYTYVFTVAQGS